MDFGMTKQELEENLGTIAKSGSLKFKEENDKKEDINIITAFLLALLIVFKALLLSLFLIFIKVLWV